MNCGRIGAGSDADRGKDEHMTKDPNRYPKGLTRKKVEDIIAFYDRQTESEAIAEADAAWENSGVSLVRVPQELVEDVRRYVAERAAGRNATLKGAASSWRRTRSNAVKKSRSPRKSKAV